MKIDGINKKLLGIACEFDGGFEILLDSGYFYDKNEKKLFNGFAEYGNKGGFKVWWNTSDLKYFRHWIEDIDWKNIGQNSWNSFKYKSGGHLCEDSYGKYGYWYKTRADHKNGIELDKRLSEKDFEKVKGFNGLDYVENNVDSAYRGGLPSRIRFFYNDFTYDYFEEDYEWKKKNSVYSYKWTIGHYTQRLKKDLKDGVIDVEHYINFPKKYKMRYKTRKKILKDPTTFYDVTIAKKLSQTLAVKKWSYIIKKLSYPYK